jgi:long-chain acyl-CoA synthetase
MSRLGCAPRASCRATVSPWSVRAGRNGNIADAAIMAIGAVTVRPTPPTPSPTTRISSGIPGRGPPSSPPRHWRGRLTRPRPDRRAGPAGLHGMARRRRSAPAPGRRPTACPAEAATLMAEVEQIPAGRLACLIYTSGTGGTPRGVMLPHRAMLANRDGASRRWPSASGSTAALPLLPAALAQLRAHGRRFLLPLARGGGGLFARGRPARRRVPGDPAAIVTAVPRLFEVLRGPMLAQIEKEGPSASGSSTALALGWRRMEGAPLVRTAAGRGARPAGAGEGPGALRRPAGRHGVRRRPARPRPVRLLLGARACRCSRATARARRGPSSASTCPWKTTAARWAAAPRRRTRIAPDGEILVRGDLVMDGYWTDAEATSAAPWWSPRRARRPWLHTGDVGRLEGWPPRRHRPQARLHQDARRRHGEPGQDRGLLMAEPEIAQAVAAGEGQARDRRPAGPGRGHGGGSPRRWRG